MKNTIYGKLLNGFKVREPAKKTPAEEKKCKSCDFYRKADGICNFYGRRNPLRVACEQYRKRGKK